MADTGHGASITFSGGFSATCRMLKSPQFELPAVDDTHLGITGSFMTSIPGDLQNIGEIEMEFQFNPNSQPTFTVQTITLRFPVPSGQTNGATLAGTGFLTKWGDVELKTNELMVAKGSIKFDGKTGPTWTASS